MRPSRCLLAELRSRPKASSKASPKTSSKTSPKTSPKSPPKTASKTSSPQPLPNYKYNHPWLCSLKLDQLTKIARATGVRSGGTKGILCQRLDQELPKGGGHENAGLAGHDHDGQDMGLFSGPGAIDFSAGMSILSIDMGIKNLAYAHLIVPGRKEEEEQRQQQGEGEGEGEGKDANTDPLPILNAWRRIDVSRLPNDALSVAEAAEMMKMSNQKAPSAAPTPSSALINAIASEEAEAEAEAIDIDDDENSTTTTTTTTTTTSRSRSRSTTPSITEDEEFLPLALAPRAYTLVSALLDAYKPTHVLIERQRFRNQSAAAVFESTLRVGVFEGMLYSTFLALARERGGMAPLVLPIEPPRVVRFLAERTQARVMGYDVPSLEGREEKKKKKKKTTTTKDEEITGVKSKTASTMRLNNRESKNLKIDLVGLWLASSTRSGHHFDLGAEAESKSQEPSTSLDPNSSTTTTDTISTPQPKLTIAPNDNLLHRWINAYLTKWPGLNKGSARKTRKKRDDVIFQEVRKLDDLADSLAQGVTWLEWMRMRDRVARGGSGVMVGVDVDGEGDVAGSSSASAKSKKTTRSKTTKTTTADT